MKKYNGGMKKQDVGIIVFAVILLLLFLSWNVFAAEILVKATDSIHPNPTEDLRGSYKRGYPVVVMPDGHIWGSKEGLPNFVVIKIPNISIEKVQKYIQVWQEQTGIDTEGRPIIQTIKRRLWQIRWADLPLAARNKLQTTGQLTIKATAAYIGTYDYTWAQIKTFMRNLKTGLDETEDIK